MAINENINDISDEIINDNEINDLDINKVKGISKTAKSNSYKDLDDIPEKFNPSEHNHNNANEEKDGFMSKEDYNKLTKNINKTYGNIKAYNNENSYSYPIEDNKFKIKANSGLKLNFSNKSLIFKRDELDYNNYNIEDGDQGERGDQGEQGNWYKPTIDEESNIGWEETDSNEELPPLKENNESIKIKGLKGSNGKDGINGKDVLFENIKNNPYFNGSLQKYELDISNYTIDKNYTVNTPYEFLTKYIDGIEIGQSSNTIRIVIKPGNYINGSVYVQSILSKEIIFSQSFNGDNFNYIYASTIFDGSNYTIKNNDSIFKVSIGFSYGGRYTVDNMTFDIKILLKGIKNNLIPYFIENQSSDSLGLKSLIDFDNFYKSKIPYISILDKTEEEIKSMEFDFSNSEYKYDYKYVYSKIIYSTISKKFYGIGTTYGNKLNYKNIINAKNFRMAILNKNEPYNEIKPLNFLEHNNFYLINTIKNFNASSDSEISKFTNAISFESDNGIITFSSIYLKQITFRNNFESLKDVYIKEKYTNNRLDKVSITYDSNGRYLFFTIFIRELVDIAIKFGKFNDKIFTTKLYFYDIDMDNLVSTVTCTIKTDILFNKALIYYDEDYDRLEMVSYNND